MNLKEYLFRKNLMVRQFGEMINYSPRYVSQVMNRHLKPGAKFIKTIEKATGGQVTEEELLTGKKNGACNCACCRKHRFPDEAA